MEEHVVQFLHLSLSVIQFTFIISIRCDGDEYYHEQTMLRSQLIHIGLLCPTHGHKHVHIALRRSKAGTQWRDSRGIVTRASISVHKRKEGKKLLWRVKGAGKEQVSNFWEESEREGAVAKKGTTALTH